MRTTLNIDEDVLITARRLAAEEGSSVGKVISRVVRAGLDHMRADGEITPSAPNRPTADEDI